MAVYYKFKSAKDYDSIPIEGQFISVANLKERIFESKHLGRRNDFDLMVSNAQNNEEYVDDGAMIPRNTSLLIRRVPGRPRNPIVTERAETKLVDQKVEDIPPSSNMLVGDSSAIKYNDEYEWDEFGNDLYSIPDVHTVQPVAPVIDVFPSNRIDEESKIRALVDMPALDWNRQGHDSYGSGRGFGRGMSGRMNAGHGFGRGGFEKKTPPAGYICHRCKIPGHFIQHCPTNGDPSFDIKRVKPPTGIPRSMLMATPDGSYALPSGAVAVLKPNEAAFEKEVEGLPSTRSISDIPPELRCPFCKEIMKDAVLTSKCCFKSFCDKCIRNYILANLMCVCGATNMLADDLLPNKTLRDAISRIMETTTSSTENAGSFVHVQDMESARHVQPRAPSPTLSVASKDEHKQSSPAIRNADSKGNYGTTESKADNVLLQLVDTKIEKSQDPFDSPPDSTNVKESVYTETVLIPEEAQDKLPPADLGKKKKKKKTRISGNGADMQWKNFQDFGAENFAVMPMGPSSFDPYWANGMPIGMDGYAPPIACSMPFMGYTPGPFDVPFGGMLQHDPYAMQGYMLPGFPQRDLAELGMNGFGMSHRPPIMNREEFDARKGDMKRKRETDRGEREKGQGKEVSSTIDAPYLPKAKPRVRSEAANVDLRDRDRDWVRDEKLEMMSNVNKHGASPQHSPPESVKRKLIDCDNESMASAGDAPSKADRKSKGSVFSRISFPAEITDGDRRRGKRKTSSLDSPIGMKDIHDRERHRPVANGYPTSSFRKSSGEAYDYESSDEERHFKRRLSARRGSEERTEETVWQPRVSRERERR